MTTHNAPTKMRFQSRADSLRLAARMAEEAEMIGKRIRERRRELELTQRQLAEALPGKTESKDVSRWENGKHLPHPSTLAAVAEGLGTTVADLRAGPMDQRNAPKPGDLNQLTPEAKEVEELRESVSALDGKLDRVLSQIAGLAGEVAKLQSAPPGQRGTQPRAGRPTAEHRND